MDLEQRLQMETQSEMISMMLATCRDRTLKKSHTQAELSVEEKTQFENCLMKFFATPQHVMMAMNGAQ